MTIEQASVSLRNEASRVRQLARDVADEFAQSALLALADEYEARADECEANQGPTRLQSAQSSSG